MLRNYGRPIMREEIVQKIGPKEHPVILEIGCNDGTDSLELLKVPGVELHCFECDPRPIKRFMQKVLGVEGDEAQATVLQSNDPQSLRKALGDASVFLHPYAIGKEDGLATFHQSGGTTPGAHLQDWDLSGSLKPPAGHLERHKWCKFENTIQVSVARLDQWALFYAADKPIDFIWLDVQGAEGDVFAGAKDTLERTRYLYCEFNDWKKPLYDGDLTLEQTIQALGGGWSPLCTYEKYNVLLENKHHA